MKHSKDKFSTNVEGSPAEEMRESAAMEAKEPPNEHELDSHHDTLMRAEKIKNDPHIMKHLKPHMEKKMGHMKSVMGEKITSTDGLRKKEKSLSY